MNPWIVKKYVNVFDGTKTSLAKNTVVPPLNPKRTLELLQALRSQNSFEASEKMQKLRDYCGLLGEDQIGKIHKMCEDQSGLSCEKCNFLSLYPVAKADPVDLEELLKED
ncbi:unnamed protein product [Caenorhabditis nigoni]